MGTTKLPRERLQQYFDNFTKRFVNDRSPESVNIHVIGTDMGDQHMVDGARLRGITYDTNDNALDIFLDAGDHRVREPQEVWVEEESDGFVSSIEVVSSEGEREIVNLRRIDLGRRT